MDDQRLEDLRRRLEADPSNAQLQLELLNARARIEGASVYLELLEDRLKWNQHSHALQDQAILEVERRLGEEYLLERILEKKSFWSFLPWKHSQTGTSTESNEVNPTEFHEKSELARIYSCNGHSHRIASFKHIKSGLILNLIPGGSYIMGDDKSPNPDEKPTEKITMEPLLIGRFPVTQSCWDRIGGDDNRKYNGPDLPMEGVSWEDCQKWLKNAGGSGDTQSLRLPKEAEWEYSCRAGSTTQYFWAVRGSGEEMDNSYCWYHKNCYDLGKKTQKVTEHFEKKKWNSFGLVDMSGNVREWCEDWYIVDYDDDDDDKYDSKYGGGNVEDIELRVVRGGSWILNANSCRSAFRYWGYPSQRFDSIGFRVVRNLP